MQKNPLSRKENKNIKLWWFYEIIDWKYAFRLFSKSFSAYSKFFRIICNNNYSQFHSNIWDAWISLECKLSLERHRHLMKLNRFNINNQQQNIQIIPSTLYYSTKSHTQNYLFIMFDDNNNYYIPTMVLSIKIRKYSCIFSK